MNIWKYCIHIIQMWLGVQYFWLSNMFDEVSSSNKYNRFDYSCQ